MFFEVTPSNFHYNFHYTNNFTFYSGFLISLRKCIWHLIFVLKLILLSVLVIIKSTNTVSFHFLFLKISLVIVFKLQHCGPLTITNTHCQFLYKTGYFQFSAVFIFVTYSKNTRQKKMLCKTAESGTNRLNSDHL